MLGVERRVAERRDARVRHSEAPHAELTDHSNGCLVSFLAMISSIVGGRLHGVLDGQLDGLVVVLVDLLVVVGAWRR